MIQFGTGGWRAEIGKDFQMANIQLIGQALSDRINDLGESDKPVVIGYDRRFLSETASRWLAVVLAANGIRVHLLPRSAPTPLIMHTVKKQGLHYGLEVTASHNPSNYNGIKVIVEEGRDAPVSVTENLERRCSEAGRIHTIDFDNAVDCGIIKYVKNPFNDFLDDIISILDVEAIRNRGPRLLFDSMHGSSSYPLNTVFYTTRCTIDQINANKDAFFGGMMPAPTEYTLKALADQVVLGGYDLGLGIDGDGDRLGVIDSNGKYISANDILVLLYYYLHEYKGWKGPVVRNLATTHLLDRVAASFGEKCYEVPVGFKHISSKMDEVNAVLGGESSGGLTVRGHIHGKDSIYASALFVEMISVTGETPSNMIARLKDRFGQSVLVEYNVPLEADQKEKLMELFERGKAGKLNSSDLPVFTPSYCRANFIDGCKLYFDDDSFVICRPSGTEPLLRVFAEASTKECAQSYIDIWKNYLTRL